MVPAIDVEEHFFVQVGEVTHSQFLHLPFPQSMTIIGSTFNLELQSPGDGLQIPETSYKDKLTLDWVHLVNGDTKIQITNTGDDELEITAITTQTPNPLGLTFDLMVVISGMVIIGFSMGFTIRKPKGF